jgi:hypothetical protein
MGYTHYWRFKNNTVSKVAFNKYIKDVRTIEEFFKKNKVYSKSVSSCEEYQNERVVLFDGGGYTKGIAYGGTVQNGKFTPNGFSLNGDDSKGLDHEGFGISLGENEWNFCKTARKPYDIAVCVILLAMKYQTKSIEVSSDGNMEEWADAINLFQQIFPDRNVGLRFTGQYNDKIELVESTAQHGFTNGEIDVMVGIYKKNPDKFRKIVKKYGNKADDILQLIQYRANIVTA